MNTLAIKLLIELAVNQHRLLSPATSNGCLTCNQKRTQGVRFRTLNISPID